MTPRQCAEVVPAWHHRRMLAWLLVAVLAWAQVLGLVHRTLHALNAGGVQQATAVAAHDAGAAPFGDHDAGDGQCRLLDHAAGSDALCVLPMAWAVEPPAGPTTPPVADGLRPGPIRAALARGPPGA